MPGLGSLVAALGLWLVHLLLLLRVPAVRYGIRFLLCHRVLGSGNVSLALGLSRLYLIYDDCARERTIESSSFCDTTSSTPRKWTE